MSKELPDLHNLIAQVASQYHFKEQPSLLKYWEELIVHVLRSFVDWLSALLSYLPITSDSRMASDVVRCLLCAFGLFSLFLLVYFILSQIAIRKGQQQNGTSQASAYEQRLTALELFVLAQQKARVNDWKQACRNLLLCTLRLFDETGVLPFLSTRTNLEYCFALNNYPSLKRALEPFCERVDLIWFGARAAQEDDLRTCLAQLALIEEELGPLSSTPLPLAVSNFKW